jgi:hypothetical protein
VLGPRRRLRPRSGLIPVRIGLVGCRTMGFGTVIWLCRRGAVIARRWLSWMIHLGTSRVRLIFWLIRPVFRGRRGGRLVSGRLLGAWWFGFAAAGRSVPGRLVVEFFLATIVRLRCRWNLTANDRFLPAAELDGSPPGDCQAVTAPADSAGWKVADSALGLGGARTLVWSVLAVRTVRRLVGGRRGGGLYRSSGIRLVRLGGGWMP